jgi:hypothetical protein
MAHSLWYLALGAIALQRSAMGGAMTEVKAGADRRRWSLLTLFAALCLVAANLGGCHRLSETWLKPTEAPAPTPIGDHVCLDLHKLPSGWEIPSSSTPDVAAFGLPRGSYGLWEFSWRRGLFYRDILEYRVLVTTRRRLGISENYDLADYARGWANEPLRNEPKLAHQDVPGFVAYPADDGEIVYVGRDIDAVMECGTEPLKGQRASKCGEFDGLKPGPILLDVSFDYADRRDAAKYLEMARRLANSLKSPC